MSGDHHPIVDCVFRCIRCGTYLDEHAMTDDYVADKAAAAERAAIVAWLVSDPDGVEDPRSNILIHEAGALANAIDRGEHRKEKP